MENSYSSLPRIFEFSILSENPSFGYSRRHNHWTSSGSFLDGYGIEVAILSIADAENTSYVVLSREAERL